MDFSLVRIRDAAVESVRHGDCTKTTAYAKALEYATDYLNRVVGDPYRSDRELNQFVTGLKNHFGG